MAGRDVMAGEKRSQREVQRSYAVRLVMGFGSYAVLLVAVVWWLNRSPDTPWRIPVALLPVLPIVYGLWSMRRYFVEADELQKRMQLEGYAFGFAGAAMATLTYGFLEMAGFPRLTAWWYWSGMAVFWIIGSLLAKRGYG
jgi:hypothetical protein